MVGGPAWTDEEQQKAHTARVTLEQSSAHEETFKNVSRNSSARHIRDPPHFPAPPQGQTQTGDIKGLSSPQGERQRERETDRERGREREK